MDENLAQVMQYMSLDEDVPINLPDEDDFIAIKKNSKSLIGRHLNPEVQNMGKMLRMMPKIWKIHERVMGVALSR